MKFHLRWWKLCPARMMIRFLRQLASINSSRNSVDNNSIIDAFQFVSIDGEDMVSCENCHFLSDVCDKFCQECGSLLGEQFARNLRNEEEQETLFPLEERHEQSLLLCAQSLASDIHKTLEYMKSFSPFQQAQSYPIPAMTKLVMKFIQFHGSRNIWDDIGYHFTSENAESIHHVGLSQEVLIFRTPSASVPTVGDWCWMVATTSRSLRDVKFLYGSGQTLNYTMTSVDESLPLLCFPACCSSSMNSTVSHVSHCKYSF